MVEKSNDIVKLLLRNEIVELSAYNIVYHGAHYYIFISRLTLFLCWLESNLEQNLEQNQPIPQKSSVENEIFDSDTHGIVIIVKCCQILLSLVKSMFLMVSVMVSVIPYQHGS